MTRPSTSSGVGPDNSPASWNLRISNRGPKAALA